MKINNLRTHFFDRLFQAKLIVTTFIPLILRGIILKLRSKKAGKNIRIDKDCLFFHTRNFMLGSNIWIARRTHISGLGGLTIGDNVQISFDAVILTEDHVYKDKVPFNKSGYKIAPVSIGNNVLIGTRAVILPGVKIGNNVVIGAGSVVTKNIPSNSIVAGIPAKVIKKIK